MIAQVTEKIAKIKILRQYLIPVGDPAGTLSAIGLTNRSTVRIYTTLRMHKVAAPHPQCWGASVPVGLGP